MPRWTKKKILLLAFLALAGIAAFIFGPLLFLPPVSDLKSKKANFQVTVRDWEGKEHPYVLGPKNRRWTPLSRIPSEMKWAVVVAEDGRFFEHEGVDYRALKAAIQYDLEKKRLARGASTITQQLAKNVFLSREKTVTRKLRELVLAHRIEQEITKGRILELYLNVVELGPMIHGVGHASRFYFGKPASQLTPRECAFLAAMLPGPRVAFNPYRNLRKVEKYADRILLRMRQRGVLTEGEYRRARSQSLNIAGLERKVKRTLESAPPPAEPLPDLGLIPENLFGEPTEAPPEGVPSSEEGGASEGAGESSMERAPVSEEETAAPEEAPSDAPPSALEVQNAGAGPEGE